MINGVVGVHDIPPEFLQIKKDNKFFSRLLSKESSKGGETSFRVLYYGGTAGSIPFTWESRPGTPKHPSSDNSIPPLAPPPSYQLSPRSKTMRRHSKPNFLGSIFGRRNSRKSDNNDKFASFSSSSSSSHSLPSTPMRKRNSPKKEGMARSMSAVQFGVHDDDHEHEQMETSPTSTLCLSAGIKFGGKSGSSHPIKNVMKRAFLSIASHGTAKGPYGNTF